MDILKNDLLLANRYLSVVEATLRTGFSQLQLWILIRNNLIKSKNILGQTKIEHDSLRTWIISNSSTSLNFCMCVDERNRKFSVRQRIRKQITQTNK